MGAAVAAAAMGVGVRGWAASHPPGQRHRPCGYLATLQRLEGVAGAASGGWGVLLRGDGGPPPPPPARRLRQPAPRAGRPGAVRPGAGRPGTSAGE